MSELGLDPFAPRYFPGGARRRGRRRFIAHHGREDLRQFLTPVDDDARLAADDYDFGQGISIAI